MVAPVNSGMSRSSGEVLDLILCLLPSPFFHDSYLSYIQNTMAETPPPRDPFPAAVEASFLDLVQTPGYVNRERLSYEKYVRIQAFLDNPTLKSEGSADSRIRYEAVSHFERHEGVLCRKPDGRHSEYREVIPLMAAFRTLTRVHLQLGHPGRDKMWSEIDSRYYGLKKEECHWIKTHCAVCILNEAGKNKAPLNPIVVNETFERV